jgi:chemotaxis protein methyltransferase CheR
MTSTDDLDRIAAAVRGASGICLRRHQYDALAAAFARSIGPLDRAHMDAVQRPGDLLDRLVDEVAVKETTFLRDRQQLEVIDWRAIIESSPLGDNGVCIWSAGCATGEEVYSLAMMACEAFPFSEPPFRIVGTDLSAKAIAAARRGRYRERALREVDEALRNRYFTPDDGAYVVNSRLRRLVSFERHNMVTDPTPPPQVDHCAVIVCRNVFIYFEPPTVQAVLGRFQHALADDGVVILGAADALVAPDRQKAARLAPGKPRSSSSPQKKEREGHPHRPRPPAPLTTPPVPAHGPVEAALQAAGRGRLDEALGLIAATVEEDPFDSHALYVRAVIELLSGQPNAAILSLRAALYADPTFGIAAFMLGRAYDANGDAAQARRAYERSLRLLESADRRHDYLLAQVDVGDVAAACRLRLATAS